MVEGITLSSENDSLNSWSISFVSGDINLWNKDMLFFVRACRAFTAAIGAYYLRNTGPGGGLIFYANGTNYIEAASSNQSDGKAWSNIIDQLSGASGTAIGTGLTNSNAIVAQAGHTSSAAKLCLDYVNSWGSTVSAAKVCDDLIS